MGSIADTTEHAVDHVKDTAAHAAGHAKGSLMEFGTQVLKLVNRLHALETRGVDAMLDGVGLQRRESALRPVLWFAAGAVAAGAIVMFLAPTSGKELRDRIVKFLDHGRSEANADAKKTTTATVEPRIAVRDETPPRANGEKTDHVA